MLRIQSCVFSLLLLLGFSLSAQNDTLININGKEGEGEDLTELQLAQQYFENQEYEKAIDYLDEVLDKGLNKRAYHMAFDIYILTEEWRKAEKLARKYAEADRGMAHEYEADLLFAYLAQDDKDDADELVAEIMQKIKQQPSRAYIYGKTFQDKGYPRLALQAYEAGENQNARLNFDYQKALLYGELGDIENMYRMYVEMIEHNPNYLNTVKVLISRAITDNEESKNLDYLKQELIKRIQAGGPRNMNELLVHVYIQEKNFRGAFTQLKALERQDAASPGELMRLAKVSLQNQEFNLAQRIYQYVARKGKEDVFYRSATLGYLDALYQELLAMPEVEPKQWEDLVNTYQDYRPQFNGDLGIAQLHQVLAQIYAYRLGRTDTAEALLRMLFNMGYLSTEDKARAQVQLADLLLYTGNRWDAIIYYGRAEKAFEQSPIGQEAKFKRAKAAYYVGDFQWAQGIFDVLKESTSKQIANDAMQYSLLINDNIGLDTTTDAMQVFAKADLYNYQGQLDSALYLLERMEIGFVGHNIIDEALLLKGDIYYRKKDFPSAEAAWQKIVEQHADDILADDALYRLANMKLEIMGEREKAMELYEKLFTEHIDSFYASDARKKFRELRGDEIN